jgi:hypothetical protein
MTALPDHGANLDTVFRQPLKRRKPRSIYPRDEADKVDGTGNSRSSSEENDGEDGDDVSADSQSGSPAVPRQYGLRSVIHALWEDGAFVQPILESPDLALNLACRDLQGRTLALSGCRSALGADAAINGVLEDVHWDPLTGSYRHGPFSSPHAPRLLQSLLTCGADLLAVDNQGENALHNLLEAHNTVAEDSRPPIIRKSLQYMATHFSTLVSQPDKMGTYPLHAAL